MANHSVYDHLNYRMGGQLPRYLRMRREREDSYDDIAGEIRASYGVKVTGETVRQWCRTRLELV